MEQHRCFLCEKLCYVDSGPYERCQYRRCKSFGVQENRMYEEACIRLAVRFARKHDLRFEGWVGHFDPEKHTWYEGAGGHALFGDEVYSFDEVRTDLMMDAHPDAISQYREECLAEYYAAQTEKREERRVSYRNWLLGARHDIGRSTEAWKELNRREVEEAKRRAEQLRKEMEETLQRHADELLADSDGLY